MRFIYSLFMTLLTPWLLFRLWWKGRHMPGYRERIFERFCLNKTKACKPIDIWVHAVSLGEVIAATPLIQAFLQNHTVLVTTMTPTGCERVVKAFGEKVIHRYIPYDLPLALKRFFKQYKPRAGVIMETEIWPNLIYQAVDAKIPLFLANARLSDLSLKGYNRFKMFFKPIINCFQAILAQSTEDAKRFIALGANPKIVQVIGNIKFDLQIQQNNQDQFTELKMRWGKDRPVFIAASTHDNEESQLLSQIKTLQKGIPGIILLIAPRHPERFNIVYQLCVDAGFKTGLRSKPETIEPDIEILVLDCLGELMSFYQVSDYAFVGGSLIPVGGHNVLEPIAVKVPVFSGNQVHNFKTICHDLTEAKGIILVSNAAELVQALIQGYQNPASMTQMVENATVVFEANKGSLERHVNLIEAVLKVH